VSHLPYLAPLRANCPHSWATSNATGLADYYWIYICYEEESRPPLWSSGQSSWQQNGDVLRFLWGTNWIYICYVEESRPPLWSSGQSSWLHNRGVFCFLWGTNWIYICYVEESRPPLWSSGQSSWLHNGGVLCFLWGTENMWRREKCSPAGDLTAALRPLACRYIDWDISTPTNTETKAKFKPNQLFTVRHDLF
jgi:hypothetical protein